MRTIPVEVAYLGPIGTYAHLVAEKRYGARCRLRPLPSIRDICAYVASRPDRHGIVPVENSSGGPIYETIDILLSRRPRVLIEEELSLNVRLSLIGRSEEKIKAIYSHFAPLEHCATWLRANLPRVERRIVSSTAVAAQEVSLNPHTACLGNRRLAHIHGLDVLAYPVQADLPNLTIFFAVSGSSSPPRNPCKTMIAARTPNEPGALCRLLETFRDEQVNLSRILSRPIRGCPREYAFLIDLDGAASEPRVIRALRRARAVCVSLRTIGSYPCRRSYSS